MNVAHVIGQLFDKMVKEAPTETVFCKRKVVHCGLFHFTSRHAALPIRMATNSCNGNVCTGETGNCGCCHAEMRVVVEALRSGWSETEASRQAQSNVLICSYSPCTNCAHVIAMAQSIGTVVYETLTQHDKRGVDILRANGVAVRSLDDVLKNGFNL